MVNHQNISTCKSKSTKLILVDESGSLLTKVKGIFLVSLTIVEQSNIRKIYRKFRKFQCKHILSFGLQEEMKAHTLKEKGKINEINIFWCNIHPFIKYAGAYVKNNATKSPLKPSEMYNWLLKTALERAIDQKLICSNTDIINIYADERGTTKISYKRTLKEYLIDETNLNINKLEFKSSKNNYEIFVADINSFVMNRFLLKIGKQPECHKIIQKQLRKCDYTKIKK